MTLSKKEYDPADGGEKAVGMNKIDELMQKLADVDDKLTALNQREHGKSWAEQPRRLRDGTIIPLGDPTKGSSLANRGIIHSRGQSATYSVAKALRSVFEKDKSIAPLEWAVSQKMEALGYHSSAAGSMQVPLGLDLWAPAGKEAEAEALSTEVKGLFPPLAAVDPGEIAWLRSKGIKAMDPLDETAGGSLIPGPTSGPLIDLLRPASAVLRAGGYAVPLPPQGSIEFPKLKADATFSWGPPPNVSLSESDPGTGTLKLTAKRATAYVEIPMDLIRYSLGATEAMVRRSLMLRGGLTLDLAALEGLGGTASPLGIIHHPLSAADTPTTDCITSHTAKTVGATGNTFTPSDVLVMLGNVEEANATPTGFVMRPRLWAGLLNSRADAVVTGDQAGLFLFSVNRGDIAAGMPTQLSGTNVYTSTQVSKSRTKGQGTGLTYVLAGDFTQLYLGQTAGVEIASSVDVKFKEDQMVLRAILRADTGLAWAQAFCVCDQLVIPT